MGVKRQQGSGDQKDLFDQALQASLRHDATGEGGIGPGAREEPQALATWGAAMSLDAVTPRCSLLETAEFDEYAW